MIKFLLIHTFWTTLEFKLKHYEMCIFLFFFFLEKLLQDKHFLCCVDSQEFGSSFVLSIVKPKRLRWNYNFNSSLELEVAYVAVYTEKQFMVFLNVFCSQTQLIRTKEVRNNVTMKCHMWGCLQNELWYFTYLNGH